MRLQISPFCSAHPSLSLLWYSSASFLHSTMLCTTLQVIIAMKSQQTRMEKLTNQVDLVILGEVRRGHRAQKCLEADTLYCQKSRVPVRP